MTTSRTGAELVCDVLHEAGITCVFGLPGTQNVPLYEALRRSALHTVVATSELSAAMMANGYYRSSGRVATVATIPGPGLTWALTGLAEAFLDSAALLHLVGQAATSPGTRFQLQAIDQTTLTRAIVKGSHEVGRADDIVEVLRAACAQTIEGEPGPVLVQVARAVLDAKVMTSIERASTGRSEITLDRAAVGQVADAMANAARCLIFAGQGAQAAAGSLVRLAERLGAAVVTTTSGRGVVPEDHPLALTFELGDSNAEMLNALVEASDCVLAIGCKFSHNGSRGFDLRIAEDKLFHVDTSADVLGANYPARLALRADANALVMAMLGELDARSVPRKGFTGADIAGFRERGIAAAARGLVEPRIHGVPGGKPAEFFAALRRAMPRASCLVTDSGAHQAMARRHFRVLHPRGLITPTNLQSMGFAIGAAIGACLAEPLRPVVAVIGDGGLAMSGLELLTAVRERVNLTVIVFVDGAYGLIRSQQLATSGHAFGTEFSGPDIAAFAAAIGAQHLRLHGDVDEVLRAALTSPRVTLVEVAVGDTLPIHWMRAKSVARGMLPGTVKTWLRRLLRKTLS